MNSASKQKYPINGISTNNDRKSTFQVTFPTQDAKEDSKEILRPAQIIEHFTDWADGTSPTKALLDHVLELLSKGHFEGYTDKGLNDFVNFFQTTVDAMHSLEQHTSDKSLQWSVLRFLEHVMGGSKEYLHDAGSAIDQIVESYGSLTNGLHHFTRGTRA